MAISIFVRYEYSDLYYCLCERNVVQYAKQVVGNSELIQLFLDIWIVRIFFSPFEIWHTVVFVSSLNLVVIHYYNSMYNTVIVRIFAK